MSSRVPTPRAGASLSPCSGKCRAVGCGKRRRRQLNPQPSVSVSHATAPGLAAANTLPAWLACCGPAHPIITIRPGPFSAHAGSCAAAVVFEAILERPGRGPSRLERSGGGPSRSRREGEIAGGAPARAPAQSLAPERKPSRAESRVASPCTLHT